MPTNYLIYRNETSGQGQSLQRDVEVDGVNFLQTDGDVDEIRVSITWTSQTSWQGVEAYVIDPDGTQHDIFTAGSLPFGSGQRTDSLTIATNDFPSVIDGTWEFYIADQMFNSVDFIQSAVLADCTQLGFPATYSETIWHNVDTFRGGFDLSPTTTREPLYPENGATIVANTGSSGTNAFSFDGTDDVWQNRVGSDAFDNATTCSWSMWCNPDQLSTKKMIFCNHGYRKGNWQIYLSGSTVNLFVGYWDPTFASSDGMRTYANSINTAGQWYHIVIIFDGSEPLADRVKIWIDNQAESVTNTEYGNGVTALPYASLSGADPPLAVGGLVDTSLGGAPSGTIRYPFDGLVDDVRAWAGYKLTQDDRDWLYTGRGVAGGPTDPFKAFYIPPSPIVGTFQ